MPESSENVPHLALGHERLVPKRPKKFKRRETTDDKGLYTASDAKGALNGAIVPALIKALGGNGTEMHLLRSRQGISVERRATITISDDVSRDYSVYAQQAKGEKLNAEILIREMRRLNDHEILVQWPQIEASELGDELRMTSVATLLGEATEENGTELSSYDQERFLEANADAIEDSLNLSDDTLAKAMYEADVFEYHERALTLQLDKAPSLRFESGYMFDDETYAVASSNSHHETPQIMGDTPAEMEALAWLSRMIEHEVDGDSYREFEEALAILGLMKRRRKR